MKILRAPQHTKTSQAHSSQFPLFHGCIVHLILLSVNPLHMQARSHHGYHWPTSVHGSGMSSLVIQISCLDSYHNSTPPIVLLYFSSSMTWASDPGAPSLCPLATFLDSTEFVPSPSHLRMRLPTFLYSWPRDQ